MSDTYVLSHTAKDVDRAITQALNPKPLTINGVSYDGTNPVSVNVINSINGRTGQNINLDATDVGARPDDWLPTVNEIGATPISHIEDKNNPHGVTIEQIGAAPSGYGYGGAPILLSSTLLRSDVELEAVLEPIFSEMAAFRTKLIQFVGYPDNSDYSWFGILSKSSNNYGSLFAHSAYSKGQMISKAKVGGTWQPCEWENPPMVLGVEYRTTERHNGKVVYATRLTVGQLVNNGTTSTSLPSVPTEIIEIYGTIKSDAYNEEVPFPIITTSGSVGARLSKEATKSITVRTYADYSGYIATATVKYTKD